MFPPHKIQLIENLFSSKGFHEQGNSPQLQNKGFRFVSEAEKRRANLLSEAAEDLHVEAGFDSEYRFRYIVNFIPKYILIGRDGRIIKANITEPSFGVEQMIEEALEKEAPSL